VGAGDTIIRAGRVLVGNTERPACVVLRGELIAEVVEHVDPGDAQVIDLPDNQVLLPGLIDSHVHVNEPGRTEWEGFETATAAAAAGGVTTIVDMPLNSVPTTVDVAALHAKQRAAAGQLAVDVAFWGGAVPGNADRLRPLHDAGVVGFKCFLLPSGVDEFPPLAPDDLAAAMRTIAGFDGLLIAHAEDEAALDASRAHGPRYADFVASRPDRAEVRAIRTLLAETARTGCRTHIVHVSSATALPLIRAAKDAGLPLTAETCPHYLTLSAEDVLDGATEYKCCPPIRAAANQDALWAALLEGTLDCVVSDHSPCPPELKAGADFGTAWGGIASVQLGLPVVWTAARERGIPLAQVVHWMAGAPAALTGLADRGSIASGQRADLCVFAPDETFVVDPGRLRHRHKVTPYAGRTLAGVVEQTWLAGRPIDDERRGRLVTLASSPPRESRSAPKFGCASGDERMQG
jgi:allantoinase